MIDGVKTKKLRVIPFVVIIFFIILGVIGGRMSSPFMAGQMKTAVLPLN